MRVLGESDQSCVFNLCLVQELILQTAAQVWRDTSASWEKPDYTADNSAGLWCTGLHTGRMQCPVLVQLNTLTGGSWRYHLFLSDPTAEPPGQEAMTVMIALKMWPDLTKINNKQKSRDMSNYNVLFLDVLSQSVSVVKLSFPSLTVPPLALMSQTSPSVTQFTVACHLEPNVYDLDLQLCFRRLGECF